MGGRHGARAGAVIAIGVLVGLVAGAVMGTANGILVAYLRMQPMIATLAMMLVVWGLAMVISGTSAVPLSEFSTFLALSGVNVRRWKMLVYTLAGTFTGLAGILMASRLASGKPDVGQSYEMYAIAAAVLGGASLQGGRASVFGSVVGAIVIATIRNGAVLMGIPDQWQKVLLGVVVLAAVYLDARRRKS